MSIVSYFGLFTILLGILLIAIYLHIKVKKKVKKLEKYIENLESELLTFETHTNGAFTGSYFTLKKLENKFNNHYHSYNFDDGVLYIKEPIVENDYENCDNTNELNND